MVKNSLLKAAAFFCPQGKAVLELTSSPALTTVQVLKGLQAKLDQPLEQHYRQRTSGAEQKVAAEALTGPSCLGR